MKKIRFNNFGSRLSAGNITIELAFLIPVMATVLAMVLYVSLLLYWQNQLDNAAHRLLKLTVLQHSSSNVFTLNTINTDARRILRELESIYPERTGQFGVALAIVSDNQNRNMQSQVGNNCHENPLTTNINGFNTAKTPAMDQRNIAALSVCIYPQGDTPLAAYTSWEYANLLGNIQQTSFYPVSAKVFLP